MTFSLISLITLIYPEFCLFEQFLLRISPYRVAMARVGCLKGCRNGQTNQFKGFRNSLKNGNVLNCQMLPTYWVQYISTVC